MSDTDNIELKKRSRRRLVGAAALALLAAIVLPMVMDKEPGIPVQDIQVTIPDRDADGAVVRPIGGRAATNAEAPVAPSPEEQAPVAASGDPGKPAGSVPAEGAPAPETAVKPLPAAPVSPSMQPAPSATSALAPPSASLAAQAAPQATPTRKEIPAPPVSTALDSDRAKAILEGRASSPSDGGGDGFVIQVGAFSEATKAASIAGDLKKRGFAAYTEKAGSMTRVRIGPYRVREDADRAAQRLRAGGVSGSVMSR